MFSVKWIVGVVAVVAVLVSPLALSATVLAHDFEGDLTAAVAPAPFGGDVVGTFEIEVDGQDIEIEASVDISAPSGYVLEGWLVDPDHDYKLSLGELEGGELEFEQRLVNPFTYNVLVITMEPAGDPDPNAAAPVAGALLPAPFGQ